MVYIQNIFQNAVSTTIKLLIYRILTWDDDKSIFVSSDKLTDGHRYAHMFHSCCWQKRTFSHVNGLAIIDVFASDVA